MNIYMIDADSNIHYWNSEDMFRKIRIEIIRFNKRMHKRIKFETAVVIDREMVARLSI